MGTMTSQTADTTKDNATRPESQSASSSTRTAELASTKKKLHTSLRNFPDFPIKGIDFADILPLFAEFEVHTQLIRALELEVLHLRLRSRRNMVRISSRSRRMLSRRDRRCWSLTISLQLEDLQQQPANSSSNSAVICSGSYSSWNSTF